MFYVDLLVVLFIAIVLTSVFAVGIRRRRNLPVILSFFVILFLSTWAVGVWMKPTSALWGLPGLSYLLVGILFALILTVLIPLAKYRGKGTKEEEEKEVAIVAFDLYFWILVVGLIIAIIARYVTFSF